ncbi:hypothetical protein XAR_0389 [Xanthomonas citri pv. glycines str. 8ra]|nr:hypothetical protein XAR_0389 [Xanthomonas citri pv. glycines str. 8ra]
MARNTTGNAGAQVDVSTQDASLAASVGIVKMSVALSMKGMLKIYACCVIRSMR